MYEKAFFAAIAVALVGSFMVQSMEARGGAEVDTMPYEVQLGIAQQQDTPVIAVIDRSTGKVRACWISGPESPPVCSKWSNSPQP